MTNNTILIGLPLIQVQCNSTQKDTIIITKQIYDFFNILLMILLERSPVF